MTGSRSAIALALHSRPRVIPQVVRFTVEKVATLNRERTKHQHRSQISIASFGDATQSILSTGRILFGNRCP